MSSFDLAKRKILILGCGYLGTALGLAAARQGARVYGLRRRGGSSASFASGGRLEVLEGDLHAGGWDRDVPADIDTVFNFLSAGGQGLEGYRRNYRDAQDRVAEWAAGCKKPPGWYVFTGSTRVYPQGGDAWVCEEDAPEELPGDPAGNLLRQAEKKILSWGDDLFRRRVIIRLAGIYGPGREFLLRQIREGVTFPPEETGHFLNLIHRDDIVSALLRLITSKAMGETGGEVYNLSDGQPARKREIVEWLAHQIPAVEGGFQEAFSSSPKVAVTTRRGVRSSRRIDPEKFFAQFQWKPQMADFRKGYRSVM